MVVIAKYIPGIIKNKLAPAIIKPSARVEKNTGIKYRPKVRHTSSGIKLSFPRSI